MNPMKQFGAKSDKNSNTVIGTGIVLEAAMLKGSGIVRIDGKYIGTIDIEGHLVLGESGVLDGEIRADSALFAGEYQGYLRINDTLHITSTAVLSGRIEAGTLIVDDGAVFKGDCTVTTIGTQQDSAVMEAAKDAVDVKQDENAKAAQDGEVANDDKDEKVDGAAKSENGENNIKGGKGEKK